MARLRILLSMLMLATVLVLAVVYGSTYAPVIAPVMDIEAIWALEDARTESETPLITRLENNGVPLAYDKNENTFYCTLGLENEDAWPALHLPAPQAKGVRLVFVDDYAYDWCSDAIEQGYPYQVLAYTDTEFAYTQIVFTGLPIVSVAADAPIDRMEVPAKLCVSAYGHAPIRSDGIIHVRGGITTEQEKKSYHVEFTRGGNGGRNTVVLPELGARGDMILNGMAMDPLMMRESLSWAVYGQMLGEEARGAFGARRTQYAELFIDDEYRGLYLMMEPMDAQEELQKAGDAHLLTDSVYRSLASWNVGERPVLDNPVEDSSIFEQRYEPGTQKHAFSALRAYIDLLTQIDDEAFARKAEACLDIESLVDYIVFMQACGLTDNVYNNLYFWMCSTQEGMRCRFAPWDLDVTWGQSRIRIGDQAQNWMSYPVADRMIGLNVGGAAYMLREKWKMWRESVFHDENIQGLVGEIDRQIRTSGALARNAYRWEKEFDETGGYAISEFAQQRFMALDQGIENIIDCVEDGQIPYFLDNFDYQDVSRSVYWVTM